MLYPARCGTRSPMEEHRAILLVGPTGSGKTPFGELLETRGLWGRRCVHFDFGASLRRISDGDAPDGLLTQDEVEVIVTSLRTGALLEDEQFPIADKILRAFIEERRLGADDLVVLNGLPRHPAQGRRVDSILRIETVLYLACPPEVVFQRIHSDIGGDRASRNDDDLQSVRARLETFARRTEGLVEYYRRSGARIEVIEVSATTTAEEVWETLNQRT